MTLNQIKYMVKVAEYGSINKVASMSFVSQSVISTAIKNLEQELGRSLFIRTAKGVVLTPFGKTFLAYITPICEQIRLIDNMVYQKGRQANQRLRIASNGYNFLSMFLKDIYNKYSEDGIQIDLREDPSTDIMSLIANNLSDIGLCCIYDCHMSAFTEQLNVMKLEFHPITRLDLCVMVGPKNPLFQLKENWVTADMLFPYPAVMYSYMDTGPFSDVMSRLNLKTSVSLFRVSSRAALYEMVSFTDAYYLNSDYHRCNFLKQYQYDEIEYLPRRALMLKDSKVQSIIGWISRSREVLTPIQQEMVEMLYDSLSFN